MSSFSVDYNLAFIKAIPIFRLTQIYDIQRVKMDPRFYEIVTVIPVAYGLS